MMITYLWQVNIKRQQFNQNLNIKVWSRTLNYNRLLTKSELRSSLQTEIDIDFNIFCILILPIVNDTYLCLMAHSLYLFNSICVVMVSMFALCVVDRWFKPLSGQTKVYNICICCFSAKHTALRRKNKDWLAWNEDNVSEWKNPTKRVGLLPNKHHHPIIKFKLSSLWYSWEIAHLTLRQQSPAHSLKEISKIFLQVQNVYVRKLWKKLWRRMNMHCRIDKSLQISH